MDADAAHRSLVPHGVITFDRRSFLQQTGGAVLSLSAGLQVPSVPGGLQVFYDITTRRHEPPSTHPESPRRLDAALEAVRAFERRGSLSLHVSRPATEDQILRVHTPQYLKLVQSEVAAGREMLSTGDTELSRGSLDAAVAAAGTVVSAVDAVMSGRARRAFCALRPPGHHASQNRGMGFCILNNVAIGARHAAARYGVDRILIVDWDVHHGNGTQEVFWSDGSVMFFDTHQHPWYPGTGLSGETGEGKGKNLIFNNPFPAGAGRTEFLRAYRTSLIPAADRFKPGLVMMSAGFDSRTGDPLGLLTLNDADFAEMTGIVLEIARRHAGGRVVSVLEGGYSLDGLTRAVSAHVGRLL